MSAESWLGVPWLMNASSIEKSVSSISSDGSVPPSPQLSNGKDKVMPTRHFEKVLYGFLMLQILLIKFCGGAKWGGRTFGIRHESTIMLFPTRDQ